MTGKQKIFILFWQNYLQCDFSMFLWAGIASTDILASISDSRYIWCANRIGALKAGHMQFSRNYISVKKITYH